MDILETITANTRREVAWQKQVLPVDALLRLGSPWLAEAPCSMGGRGLTIDQGDRGNHFTSAHNSKDSKYQDYRKAFAKTWDVVVMQDYHESSSEKYGGAKYATEIQKAVEWLHEDAKVEAVVPAYETGGASACSVLTDGEFFGGTLEDLKQARRLVRLPLLRKDFVVDEYQLYQARAAGAAAVLLIAAVLSPDECRRFARTAHELELEVLLEVHTPSELSRLNGYVDMLGVNNRDLGTFHTDVENSFRMADLLRHEVGGGSGPLPVSESGISDPETVVRLREAGFRGFLMGEAFMKSGDPGRALAEFIARLKEARP